MTKALVVVTLACASVLTSVPPAAANDLDTDRFRVTLRTVSDHYVDVGRPGPSVGDHFTFSDNVFHQGDRVGRDDGRCDVTRRRSGSFAFLCVVTVTLRGFGQIALQGTLIFRRGSPGGGVLAVTGGTRQYRDASGTARLTERRGEPTRLYFRLR
jgi:hypothetical protein